MHKDHLARQLKNVLVKRGDGSATAEPADFEAVAKATYADVQAAQNTQGDPTLAEAKMLEKAEFFKQSRAVAKRWWNQTSGKGHDTAPVIKANFKAALRRGPPAAAPEL